MAACRMSNKSFIHQPVLLSETLNSLALKPQGIYLDATFGRGGHSAAILSHLGPEGRLIVVDKDPMAIAYARQNFSSDPRVSIYHSSFACLETVMRWAACLVNF